MGKLLFVNDVPNRRLRLPETPEEWYVKAN